MVGVLKVFFYFLLFTSSSLALACPNNFDADLQEVNEMTYDARKLNSYLLSQMESYSESTSPTEETERILQVIVTLNSELTDEQRTQLESLDVVINSEIGQILTCEIPLRSISHVSRLTYIVSLESNPPLRLMRM